MRLWHEKLIPFLPDPQLLGQHRECCALRGNGWGKKHSTVDYVFEHPPEHLVAYHYRVMEEMQKRGMNVSEEWLDADYRGKNCERLEEVDRQTLKAVDSMYSTIYFEHDTEYLIECILNLQEKGVDFSEKITKIDERGE